MKHNSLHWEFNKFLKSKVVTTTSWRLKIKTNLMTHILTLQRVRCPIHMRNNWSFPFLQNSSELRNMIAIMAAGSATPMHSPKLTVTQNRLTYSLWRKIRNIQIKNRLASHQIILHTKQCGDNIVTTLVETQSGGIQLRAPTLKSKRFLKKIIVGRLTSNKYADRYGVFLLVFLLRLSLLQLLLFVLLCCNVCCIFYCFADTIDCFLLCLRFFLCFCCCFVHDVAAFAASLTVVALLSCCFVTPSTAMFLVFLFCCCSDCFATVQLIVLLVLLLFLVMFFWNFCWLPELFFTALLLFLVIWYWLCCFIGTFAAFLPFLTLCCCCCCDCRFEGAFVITCVVDSLMDWFVRYAFKHEFAERIDFIFQILNVSSSRVFEDRKSRSRYIRSIIWFTWVIYSLDKKAEIYHEKKLIIW